jgi:hypothetical protein
MNYIRLITFLYALFLIRDDKLKKNLQCIEELSWFTQQNKTKEEVYSRYENCLENIF